MVLEKSTRQVVLLNDLPPSGSDRADSILVSVKILRAESSYQNGARFTTADDTLLVVGSARFRAMIGCQSCTVLRLVKVRNVESE